MAIEDRMATMVSDNGSNWVLGVTRQVARPGGGCKNLHLKHLPSVPGNLLQ